MRDPKDQAPETRAPDREAPEGDPTARPPRARMGRGVRVLLFASLALNLAVVGLVLGFVLRAPFDGPPPRPDRVGGALTFALSDEDRHEIGRRVFRELRADGRDRRSRRADYDRILTALRADPYDARAVQDLLEAQRQDAARFQAAGQRALLAHIDGMSPEARRAFADRLEEGLERFDARHRDGPPRAADGPRDQD